MPALWAERPRRRRRTGRTRSGRAERHQFRLETALTQKSSRCDAWARRRSAIAVSLRPRNAREVARRVTLATGRWSMSAVAASRSRVSSRRAGLTSMRPSVSRSRFLHGSGSAVFATATRRFAPCELCKARPRRRNAHRSSALARSVAAGLAARMRPDSAGSRTSRSTPYARKAEAYSASAFASSLWTPKSLWIAASRSTIRRSFSADSSASRSRTRSTRNAPVRDRVARGPGQCHLGATPAAGPPRSPRPTGWDRCPRHGLGFAFLRGVGECPVDRKSQGAPPHAGVARGPSSPIRPPPIAAVASTDAARCQRQQPVSMRSPVSFRLGPRLGQLGFAEPSLDATEVGRQPGHDHPRVARPMPRAAARHDRAKRQ